jgi:hypothetical protein
MFVYRLVPLSNFLLHFALKGVSTMQSRFQLIRTLVVFGLLVFIAGSVSAQNFNITLDEYGNGIFNGSPLPFSPSAVETTFSGQATLMYQLPFTVVRGDLILTDGTVFGDIVRFDNNAAGGVAYFFSDLPESGEFPVPFADKGIPNPSPLAPVIMPEIGPEGSNGATYFANIGLPGSAILPGQVLPVNYTIISDGVAVPEPSAFALLGAGLLLMLGCRWRITKTRANLTLTAAAVLLATTVSTPARANLLLDSGFESGTVTTAANVLGNFPVYQGQWGQEMASDTGPSGAVTPFQGVLMHSMSDAGGVATQTFQATDVSAYSALINSGSATVNMTAMFDVDKGLPAAIGAVYVSFFTGNNYGTLTSTIGNNLTLDTSPATWEPISVSGAIPVGTTWMVSQVVYNNASLYSPNGVMYPGFVDAADLTITSVPEPGTFVLLAAGGLGLAACVWRRRHPRRLGQMVSL